MTIAANKHRGTAGLGVAVAILVCGSAFGCATQQDEPVATSAPPALVTSPSRWESEYRTGSRLPMPDRKASSTVQPVYQFDAVEYQRERPPAGTHAQ